MAVSVFIGTSVDGFIARRNGALDFLPPGGGELHGYDEFMMIQGARNTSRTDFHGAPADHIHALEKIKASALFARTRQW